MYQKPSPNQQICYVDDEPFVIAYKKDILQNPIEAAIEVIDVVEVLRPVFEVTSADLRLGCSRKDDRKKDTHVNPPETGWHIRQAHLPLGAEVEREFGANPSRSPSFEVEALSKSALIDWVKKAFNQKCPNSETYDLAWFTFNFNTVRTKIFTEELLVGQSMIKTIYETRHGTYELNYPLIREKGQLWVYSPNTDWYRFSAFKIRVNHDDWAKLMVLNIEVGWTWWTQKGFKEREVLLNTVPQIEALGWNLEFFDDLEAAYIPR